MVAGVFGLAGSHVPSRVEMVFKVGLDHVTIQHLCTVVDSVLVVQEIPKLVTTRIVQVFVFFKYISHTFAFLMKYTYTIFLSNRTNCLNPSSEFITQTMSNCN